MDTCKFPSKWATHVDNIKNRVSTYFLLFRQRSYPNLNCDEAKLFCTGHIVIESSFYSDR